MIYINCISCYNQVLQAMSSNYLKIFLNQTLKEALMCMRDGQQNCVLVVDADDYLEGILTYGDIRRSLYENPGHASNGDTSNPDVRSVFKSNKFMFSFVLCVGVAAFLSVALQ